MYHLNPKNPRIWGSLYWDMFFKRAMLYPVKNPSRAHRKVFQEYYKGFLGKLPCDLCNPSFKQYWKELPIENYLDSRNDLLMWVYLLKHKVNIKLSKTSPSFGSIVKKYSKFQ